MIYFDLETTGVEAAVDRIVSIAYRITSDATGEILENYHQLVNPQMPIPPKATEVHGITDEMVKDQPTFEELAKTLHIKFTGRTVAGYNIIRFDIPLLIAEFGRAGIHWKPTAAMDLLHALRKIYPMDLSSVYARIFNKELENAHDAMADVIATHELSTFFTREHDLDDLGGIPEDLVDWGGKFRRNSDGKYEFTFGKHKGEQVTVDHVGFLEWMMDKDFHPDTLSLTRRMINTFKERMARSQKK
jgi:DNA polymerase-3 subunit epsilon